MNREFAQKAKVMRKKVFSQMLESRSWKYRSFLFYLSTFKYFSFSRTRGEFLESYYALMRYLDDIVDGDVLLPEGYLNESDFLTEKISFSNHPVNPKDEVECLMMYCFDLGILLGQDFRTETKDILDSLLFDAQRRGKKIIFPNEVLKYHFHLLDIRGTIRATLKIFKDDPDKYTILEPLGSACRHQYTIEDIEQDLEAGYINISREDCERFGIVPDDFNSVNQPKIKAWLRHHARQGMDLLGKHRQRMPKGNFTLFERAVFKVVYEIPAKKVFLKIFSQT